MVAPAAKSGKIYSLQQPLQLPYLREATRSDTCLAMTVGKPNVTNPKAQPIYHCPKSSGLKERRATRMPRAGKHRSFLIFPSLLYQDKRELPPRQRADNRVAPSSPITQTLPRLAADWLSSFPLMKRSKNLGCVFSLGLPRQSGLQPQAETCEWQ